MQHSNDAPKAIGPFSQAIQANGFVFVSGQLGVDPKTGELAGSDVTSQTNMVFANMSAVLKAAGCTMNDVVKTTVLLTDMADYTTVNAIYAKRM
jgi:2-iminobutanoate/2-iminopropanoate deaminase